jgi:NAD(P)-dependent dehydrogenase (short-subunit alcohol dehydrogenase family)
MSNSEPLSTSLAGRVALVTGGTRGIGLGICEAMSRAGSTVIVTGRDAAKAKSVADALAAGGAQASYLAADLTEDADIDALIPRALELFGGVDILVNNAGIDADNLLINHPLEDWRRVMKVNLEAPFRLGKAIAPHMFEKGRGVIINVASILGLRPTREAAAYTAAKHGLIGLTKQMALEWARDGIRVNAIAPGLIKTDMTSYVWGTEAGAAHVREAIPCGRIGEPRDIGALAAFLASDAAGFIHGETIVSDGGGLLS